MFEIIRNFKVGRPQVLAGLMLLGFLAQCLWAASARKVSRLEYQYIFSGLAPAARQDAQAVSLDSPFTSLVAALPLRVVGVLRKAGPASWNFYLALPHPWILRLPFAIFGAWLGGALWWVARRLFDNEGGYVALGLYCTSPAMIKISSNIGPEILLAWSALGLIYTAIGVSHTLYAPPKKWAPRIVILGLSIGFALATSWWTFPLVLLALGYMLYLAPDCRGRVAMVLASACALGFAVWLAIAGITGSAGMGIKEMFATPPSLAALRQLAFALSATTDGYVLVFLFIAALTTYGSWQRARYFGNTAPLVTALVCVLVFAMVPATHLWDATLALSFVFVFIGGVAADLLETRYRLEFALVLVAGFLVRIVLTLPELRAWVQNLT
jgi:dolichyl-phosphate-mannose-protein mannosyltransferase